MGLFLGDVLESTSESCANECVPQLNKVIAGCPDLDQDVDSIIGALTNTTTTTPRDDWQRAESIEQLIHDLDLMDGTQFGELRWRRQNVRLHDGSSMVVATEEVSLMEFCTKRLQQSEFIRLAAKLLEVDKFRSSLLSNVWLDGKLRKWIQLWLLCRKLIH